MDSLEVQPRPGTRISRGSWLLTELQRVRSLLSIHWSGPVRTGGMLRALQFSVDCNIGAAVRRETGICSSLLPVQSALGRAA